MADSPMVSAEEKQEAAGAGMRVSFAPEPPGLQDVAAASSPATSSAAASPGQRGHRHVGHAPSPSLHMRAPEKVRIERAGLIDESGGGAAGGAGAGDRPHQHLQGPQQHQNDEEEDSDVCASDGMRCGSGGGECAAGGSGPTPTSGVVMYDITVMPADEKFAWKVTRRYRQFVQLDKALLGSPNAATKATGNGVEGEEEEDEEEEGENADDNSSAYYSLSAATGADTQSTRSQGRPRRRSSEKPRLPPKTWRKVTAPRDIDERRRRLERYLNQLLQDPVFQRDPQLMDFLGADGQQEPELHQFSFAYRSGYANRAPSRRPPIQESACLIL